MNFDIVIKKSKQRKKTLQLNVLPNNIVEVITPDGISKKNIYKLIKDKNEWIQKRLTFYKKNEDKLSPKTFRSGDIFFYLGSVYKLQETTHQKPGVWFDKNTLMVHPKKDIKTSLELWYKECALDIFTDRITYYSERIGVQPKEIKIKKMKTRWGSCSEKGNINLNWILIMTPLTVIDYVCIHELCHLIHMNHSPSFWELVEHHYPNHKSATKWLKNHSAFLTW